MMPSGIINTLRGDPRQQGMAPPAAGMGMGMAMQHAEQFDPSLDEIRNAPTAEAMAIAILHNPQLLQLIMHIANSMQAQAQQQPQPQGARPQPGYPG